MIKNVFSEQQEFVLNDPRRNRPKISGIDAVSSDSLYVKHAILLPEKFIQNKRILDLGSCNAASGAWVLSHGASFYKGVELQEVFVKNSREALSKYYLPGSWEIELGSIEEYLENTDEEFDIVIASEILHVFSEPLKILRKIAQISKAVIIESSHPATFAKTKFLPPTLKKELLYSENYENYIENEPFIEIGTEGMTVDGEQTLLFNGLRPSMGAIKNTMVLEGFVYVDGLNKQLKKIMPNLYSPYKRFGACFIKKYESTTQEYGFASASMGKSTSKLYKWNQ